jgi:tetratricopeptide (TPR) repeat protein
MRSLLFLFVLILSINTAAQSPHVSKLFGDGTKAANASRYDAALESYRTALSAAENEYVSAGYRAQLHYNIGVCYFHLDRFELAASQFRSAILLKRDYVNAYSALNAIRMKQRSLRAGDRFPARKSQVAEPGT